jgi:DNA-directed RNA polymerase subunit H (RpoH/RPB5)
MRSNENKLWRRKRTQVEMMGSRGYHIKTSELKAIKSFNNFLAYLEKVNNDIDMLYKPQPNRNLPNTYVMFAIDLNATEIMKRVKNLAREEDIKNFIVITTPDEIPPREVLDKIKGLFTVETFEYDFFAINPTLHVKSPKYKIYSDAERENFYSKNKLSSYEMSGISIHNSIVRYYGAKLRDLIYIEREISQTSFLDHFKYWREVRDIPIFFSGRVNENVEEEENEDDDYVPDNLNEIQPEEETTIA